MCIRDRPEAHRIRSELALIANMARTIKDKEERALVMREYNIILKELMSLPTSFAGCDIIDPNMARLNTCLLYTSQPNRRYVQRPPLRYRQHEGDEPGRAAAA